METPKAEAPQPAAERVIARTPRKTSAAKVSVEKVVADCPDAMQGAKGHKV